MVGATRHLRAVAFIAASSLLVISPAANGSAGWKQLHRPLRLPTLVDGHRCPRSPARLRPQHATQWLNGIGPAYVIGVGAPRGVVDISQSVPDAAGWMGQKTPWVVKRGYTGRILIRGRRIGQGGEVRFARGFGEHLREVRWPAGFSAGGDHGFRSLPLATLVRVPGCYAFQVDAENFTEVVVLQFAR
jgi:hypothetical protein